MRVLFIHSMFMIETPEKPLHAASQIQFGISYISSMLKKHGHETRLIILCNYSGKTNYTMLDDYIKKFNPEMICVTAFSTAFDFLNEIALYVKNTYPHIYRIIGGPHASLNPDDVINGNFDAVCIGEGEYPVLDLVNQLEKGKKPSGIPNLWIKTESGIEKNPTRPFIEDLDSLPFPDRDMWVEWVDPQSRALFIQPILIGRGCPYQCTYCCNHALKKTSPGKYVRGRSPANIVEEIKQVYEQFPWTTRFYLEVESFGVNKKWAIEVCNALEDFNKTLDNPLVFGANLRITKNAEFEDLFIACRDANFQYLNIGLESGSERVRNEVLKRNYSNETIIKAVKEAKSHGMKVALYNMIGIPTETKEEFQETIEVNRKCQPDWHNTSIFYPYPGTDLYQMSKDLGLLTQSKDTSLERFKATLNLPGFSNKEIQKQFTWFHYNVYKGYRPLHKLLLKTLFLTLGSNVFLVKLSGSKMFRLVRKLYRKIKN